MNDLHNITEKFYIQTNSQFIEWLKLNEHILMYKILEYAKQNDYTKYTSTLLEAWRISIVGLTSSLEMLLEKFPVIPSMGPDDDFNNDPASQFGLIEAKRHRSRGVNYAMFISLFKYYRQSYHDLIQENKECFENPTFYYQYILSFFDRVEIAYSIEWNGRNAEDQIHELSFQNRKLANEKNLYLTVFDSFGSGALLLDEEGKVLNYNIACSKIISGKIENSGKYYYSDSLKLAPKWLLDEVYRINTEETYYFQHRVRENDIITIYEVSIQKLKDVSQKFVGYIVLFNDISKLEIEKERFELAISATNDGLWDWDIQHNKLYLSPRWKEMLGYHDDELKNAIGTWEALVHPADLIEANKAIEESWNHPEIFYQNIHRLRHKDGHYIWNLDRGKTLFDENLKPVRMIGFHTDISDLKKLESEISILKKAIDNAPISFVITNSDGTIQYANPWFNQLTGYTLDEVIGQNPKILRSGYTSEDEYQNLWNKIAHNNVWNGIFKNLRKDGSVYWESATIIPIMNEEGLIVNYLGIKQEISEKIELEEKLLEKDLYNANLAAILEEAKTEIYIFSQDSLKFIYANKSALNNTQYLLEELILTTPYELKRISQEELIAQFQQLQNSDKIIFEANHYRKDGSSYPVNIILQLGKYKGKVAWIAMATDLSEQQILANEIKTTQEVMLFQSRQAAMGEMLAMIAHQWRQPLGTISMALNNILLDFDLGESDEKEFRNKAEHILIQVDFLSKTIDDFRDFFRPDKESNLVQLSTIVNECLSIMKSTLDSRNISVEIFHNSTTPIKTYSRELLQVVINLVKNSQESLVINKTVKGTITLHTYENDIFVILDICDNGQNISPDIMKRIFEPYYSTKDIKTGTGLGLYMSKKIIESHLKGTIEAINNVNGVCFSIKLPKSQMNE